MRKYMALGAAMVLGMALVSRQRRGAGFGGLSTALKLGAELQSSDDVSILVVDRNNDMLFAPLHGRGEGRPDHVSRTAGMVILAHGISGTQPFVDEAHTADLRLAGI